MGQGTNGTTIGPHDEQQWPMMNEKHSLKMPGRDLPIASADDLGAYEDSQVPILRKVVSSAR